MHKDQINELEEQAEALRQKIEEGTVKLAQCYSEQKLVLTSIDTNGKETSPPEAADLAVGIENMQKAYTGYFSGPDSASLPEKAKAQQQEFEKAFLQMSTLAAKLAEYQQTIAKTIAGQKAPAASYAAVVGTAGGSTGPATPGTGPAAVSSGGSEAAPAGMPAEGRPAVEQTAVQAPPPTAAGPGRTTSPDRGAGGPERAGYCPQPAGIKGPKGQESRGLLT